MTLMRVVTVLRVLNGRRLSSDSQRAPSSSSEGRAVTLNERRADRAPCSPYLCLQLIVIPQRRSLQLLAQHGLHLSLLMQQTMLLLLVLQQQLLLKKTNHVSHFRQHGCGNLLLEERRR